MTVLTAVPAWPQFLPPTVRWDRVVWSAMASTTPPTLEYAPRRPRTGRGWDYLAHLIRWLLVGGVFAIVLAGVVPRFEQLFRDFKLQLPWSSQLLLALSRWFVNDYGWVPAVPLPFLLAYLLSLPGHTPQEKRKVRRWERLLAFLLIAAFLVYVIVALFMPMISLIEAISSQPSKR